MNFQVIERYLTYEPDMTTVLSMSEENRERRKRKSRRDTDRADRDRRHPIGGGGTGADSSDGDSDSDGKNFSTRFHCKNPVFLIMRGFMRFLSSFIFLIPNSHPFTSSPMNFTWTWHLQHMLYANSSLLSNNKDCKAVWLFVFVAE